MTSRAASQRRDRVMAQRRRRKTRQQADKDARAMARLVEEEGQGETWGPVLMDRIRGLLYTTYGKRILGDGSTRVILSVPGDPSVVIKVGLPDGDSNLLEARNWEIANDELRPGFVPVIEVDKSGRWLIMERVEPGQHGMDCEEDDDILHELRDNFCDLWDDNLDKDCRALDYAEIVDEDWLSGRSDPRKKRDPRQIGHDGLPRGSLSFDLEAMVDAALAEEQEWEWLTVLRGRHG